MASLLSLIWQASAPRQSCVRAGVLQAEVAKFFPMTEGDDLQGANVAVIGDCRDCGGCLRLVQRDSGTAILCNARPLCSFQVYLPRAVTQASVSGEICSICQHGTLRKLDLRWAQRWPLLFEPSAGTVLIFVADLFLAIKLVMECTCLCQLSAQAILWNWLQQTFIDSHRQRTPMKAVLDPYEAVLKYAFDFSFLPGIP